MSNDKALLCGINNYKSPSVTDLRGCVNDVESVKRLLVESFGFKTANIRTLKDAEVTKAEVKANWSWLVDGAKPGDRLVFHFSGHGSQVPDQGGDEDGESDGQDEIFCLYDMDWNDPDTYLLDDEIAALRLKVPQGASLTYFFDECHSGSAARIVAREVGGVKQMVALDVNAAQRQMDRPGVRSVDKKKAAEDPADSRSVRVRYLPPPSDFVPPKKARSAKAKPAAKPDLEYLSLSACQDDQTAADAFLDGGFHGAFTHSLCRALRDDASQSSKDLVERIHAMLREGGFAQRPASDGEVRAPIFGPAASGGEPSMVEETDRGRSEGIDDLRSEAADLLEGFVKLLRGRDRLGRRTRAASTRQLVYVHGISTHVEGYSDAWWNSLRPFTNAFGAGTRGDTRHEVLWSNLVNDRAVSAQEQQLRQRIEDVIEDRQRVEAARAIASPRPAGRDMSRRNLRSATRASERGGGLAIDDFLKYMTNDETRRRIIARFVDKVRPLVEDGADVDVIAHSWGTVVAYEGMREIGASPGRVKSFFTAGSALSLPPVRSSLRSENRDGDKPSLVDRWINLDAEGDVIGGALGDHFDVDREELDLVPTGCKRTLFGWGPFSPACAHSSYFVAENEYVNRVVFAGNLNR